MGLEIVLMSNDEYTLTWPVQYLYYLVINSLGITIPLCSLANSQTNYFQTIDIGLAHDQRYCRAHSNGMYLLSLSGDKHRGFVDNDTNRSVWEQLLYDRDGICIHIVALFTSGASSLSVFMHLPSPSLLCNQCHRFTFAKRILRFLSIQRLGLAGWEIDARGGSRHGRGIIFRWIDSWRLGCHDGRGLVTFPYDLLAQIALEMLAK